MRLTRPDVHCEVKSGAKTRAGAPWSTQSLLPERPLKLLQSSQNTALELLFRCRKHFCYLYRVAGSDKTTKMRTLRFLPLTFLVGIHGFVMFVPYLLLCLALQATLRQR